MSTNTATREANSHQGHLDWETTAAPDASDLDLSEFTPVIPERPQQRERERQRRRRRRSLGDLLGSISFGRRTPTPTPLGHRPTISRPIVNLGPVEVPGDGAHVYVHPDRPRLRVSIPRSSFSDLWGQRPDVGDNDNDGLSVTQSIEYEYVGGPAPATAVNEHVSSSATADDAVVNEQVSIREEDEADEVTFPLVNSTSSSSSSSIIYHELEGDYLISQGSFARRRALFSHRFPITDSDEDLVWLTPELNAPFPSVAALRLNFDDGHREGLAENSSHVDAEDQDAESEHRSAIVEYHGAMFEHHNVASEHLGAASPHGEIVTDHNSAITRHDNEVADRNSVISHHDDAVPEHNDTISEPHSSVSGQNTTSSEHQVESPEHHSVDSSNNHASPENPVASSPHNNNSDSPTLQNRATRSLLSQATEELNTVYDNPNANPSLVTLTTTAAPVSGSLISLTPTLAISPTELASTNNNQSLASLPGASEASAPSVNETNNQATDQVTLPSINHITTTPQRQPTVRIRPPPDAPLPDYLQYQIDPLPNNIRVHNYGIYNNLDSMLDDMEFQLDATIMTNFLRRRSDINDAVGAGIRVVPVENGNVNTFANAVANGASDGATAADNATGNAATSRVTSDVPSVVSTDTEQQEWPQRRFLAAVLAAHTAVQEERGVVPPHYDAGRDPANISVLRGERYIQTPRGSHPNPLTSNPRRRLHPANPRGFFPAAPPVASSGIMTSSEVGQEEEEQQRGSGYEGEGEGTGVRAGVRGASGGREKGEKKWWSRLSCFGA